MTEKILKLQELLEQISYPGNNERHLSYYIEEAQNLAADILTEQEKIVERIRKHLQEIL